MKFSVGDLVKAISGVPIDARNKVARIRQILSEGTYIMELEGDLCVATLSLYYVADRDLVKA